ncbi:DUF1176 domain-containing protein [Duganella radicis]|uniref:DUF1176 domain-containing protein n=1 Tax=Duganella radicis TaxID=551988 RepID=A0A6L6PL17_9BURK|nr:DUF1176 domain-containing protein [Duganella radicis]MTV39277.1 DUF1176 domain-containing protein [Duganella radicis]
MKALLLALGALTSFSATAQQFSFKDWVVACDNTRHCEAVGYQAEGFEQPVTLWLARDAGGNAAVSARMDAQFEQDDTGPYTIRAGATVVSGIPVGGVLSAAHIARLLPALKEADVALVADGRHEWELSLAGLKAALLKMDDLQGRVGTVTALSRPGAKPASAVPAALSAPVLRAQAVPSPRESDAKLLPAILKTLRDADCDADAPRAEYGRNSEIARLSATEVLVFLECTRGAYQAAYGIWRVNDKPPHKAVRILLPNVEGKTDDMLIEPYFDKGVLGSFAKGRGLADCGSADQWLWTAEGFRLKESSIGPMCRGMPGGGLMLRLWTTR